MAEGDWSTFDTLEPFTAFERVLDASVYHSVPPGSLIGVTDVVSSTQAIAAGRYKAVNMAGAAAISAVMNALETTSFPFVFGGDGAGFVVAKSDEQRVRNALAATVRWADDELGLTLRAALVPLSEVEAAGHAIRVARFAASDHVAYAMISGGGLSWAEAEMKRGRFGVAPAPAGATPDLTGLSCRWAPIAAENGVILSILVRRDPAASEVRFAALVREVLAVASGDTRGRPVSRERLRFRWPPAGVDLEARATRRGGSLLSRKLAVLSLAVLGWFAFATGRRIGGFEPARYRDETVANSDFRKFDDGLRMTIDCSAEVADRIEAMLDVAAADGTVIHGTHRQTEALMTCIVPSLRASDHLHFIDGAGGGYAAAARALRAHQDCGPVPAD